MIGMELDLAGVPQETTFKELRQEYCREHTAVVQAVYTKSPYGDIFSQAAGDWAVHEMVRARLCTRVRKFRNGEEDAESHVSKDVQGSEEV